MLEHHRYITFRSDITVLLLSVHSSRPIYNEIGPITFEENRKQWSVTENPLLSSRNKQVTRKYYD